jgi:hypothetical protein
MGDKDQRIQYYQAEWQTRQNQKFRNLKIKGVYLAFLDADDLWLLEN